MLTDKIIWFYIGNSSEDNSDEDSEENDSDMMVLPPGVGDRDGLMEGDDPLPTEWTHLNGEISLKLNIMVWAATYT